MDFATLIASREAELAAARSERGDIKKEQEAILAGVEAEQRADLSVDESTRFDGLSERKAKKDAQIAELTAKLEHYRAEQAADEEEARIAAQSVTAVRKYDEVARVGAEKRTYSPDNAREGVSFLRDVFLGQIVNDPGANERLARHMVEERKEQRDVATTAVGGLVVPQYLTELAAPKAAAGRVFADNCRKLDLPADGMTVNISRVTTSTSAAVQATQNSGVSETDIDDTLLTVDVRTIAGKQDVARQAVDRSVGGEMIIVEDLVKQYHTKLDYSILNDDGTSGTHLGLTNTSSIQSVTYTDSTPTVAEAYGPLWDLQQKIETGNFAAASHLVMHPRRWAFFCSGIGSDVAMVGFNGIGAQLIGAEQSKEYGAGVRGFLAGLPVIVDANITTTSSSTRDIIYAVTNDELFLWEQPGSPLLIRAEQSGASSLSIEFVVYGYSAFTAGRRPAAHGTIQGSGLTTPTFGKAVS